jgi:hypothetical protein
MLWRPDFFNAGMLRAQCDSGVKAKCRADEFGFWGALASRKVKDESNILIFEDKRFLFKNSCSRRMTLILSWSYTTVILDVFFHPPL